MKISEILRRAANENLSPTGKGRIRRTYSCDAVSFTISTQFDGLRALGFLDRLAGQELRLNTTAFHEFPAGKVRQGARFLWLHFAALAAEDEGL